MVSQVRADRIAGRIREDLSEILIKESQDPRLFGISVTDVKVDRELDYANIYVSAVEGSQRAPEIIAALEHAQGFLRSELARRINLRSFPRLRFHWDPTFERAEAMERLFASLLEERKKREASQPSGDLDISGDEDAAESNEDSGAGSDG
ncbi:MAG: 30S ribosome-binding factor RbfA [Chloroflexota bacterium]|nr:MAG: 30S ribosome-binding factor RbfA [Chloroflexota bacterium]